MKLISWRRSIWLLVVLSFTGAMFCTEVAEAQRNRRPAAKSKPKKPKLPPLKTPKDKMRFLEAIRQSMPTRRISRSIRYTSDDLDRTLEIQIGLSRSNYAPVVADETFIRRVYLDLTGEVPEPKEIRDFVADRDPDKREKLIDRLLETDAYARKWAKYWRSVVFYNSTANKNRLSPQTFEDWLAGEFKKNTRWDRIVAEMVSATPVRNREKKNDWGQELGPNNFVLACDNKPDELASQTARIFMGISIQCAECHDHPFDQWKREQFHELAAFFARGKYYMPDQDDPSQRTQMQPRFLLGEKPPSGLSADARRVVVAAYLIYNPDNYWFARAFVNRVWNELIGDGFYDVDSLGPDQDVLHKLVVNRIASVFRYRDFDVKWLFRTIMNTKAYQRDIRTIDRRAKYFTAVRPSRLRPDQVAASILQVTGKENQNLQRQIENTFKQDPSVPQEDLEGSIQQALLLMNNRALQNQLRASELRKRLVAIKDNREMINELYLSILARSATLQETERGLEYLRQVKNRGEAIDDLMWVLVNSTEFVTKR